MLLLKPDAVVTRRLAEILRWITARGFAITGVVTVTMDRHAIRALWQYGWNAASRDRRDAADLYVTAGDCLLVVLARPGRREPATLALSRAKGPADVTRCRPGQLRELLNFQLNLVHTADEPADLLRELACAGERAVGVEANQCRHIGAESRRWTLHGGRPRHRRTSPAADEFWAVARSGGLETGWWACRVSALSRRCRAETAAAPRRAVYRSTIGKERT